MLNNSDYWNSYYTNDGVNYPSSFAIQIASISRKNDLLFEFGCGNGRDSVFLANFFNTVISIDGSEKAIENNIKFQKSNNIKFFKTDIKDILSIDVNKNLQKTFYSRFFQHSINEQEEALQLEFINDNSIINDMCAFEFRNSDDENENKIYGNHYRRFINHTLFVSKLLDIGFEIVYSISGRGISPFKTEDPILSRIIAKKIK